MFILVEGEAGAVELGPDYWLRVTTAGDGGTHARRVPPPRYAWADPAYDLVQASIVPCHADCLRYALGGPVAETSGEDNLRTLALVSAAYELARTGQVVALPWPRPSPCALLPAPSPCSLLPLPLPLPRARAPPSPSLLANTCPFSYHY